MRESLRDPVRLDHIKDAIERLLAFMEGKTILDLETDPLLFFAVVKNFEIIGEAAYKLTHEFCDSHPETPWSDIIRMRHILVHGYYKVQARQMMHAYENDIPALYKQIKAYLQEIDGSDID